MNERFVAREQAVPASEQITLQPPLAEMFAEHLHDPAVWRDVVVSDPDLGG